MFDNFTKDKQIVDKYIDNRNIHKNDIYLLRYKLSTQNNPKEFLTNYLKDIKSNSVVVITDAIVYDEDAYLNAAVAYADNKHRRFYTVNEILDITKEYARLNFFLNFTETVTMDTMLKYVPDDNKKQAIINLLNDFPNNIKKLLSFKEENGNLISFAPNIAVFILIKK